MPTEFSSNLKPGEEIILMVRRHFLATVPVVGLAAMMMLVDFFFLTFFVSHGTWGIVVFFSLALASLWIGLRALFEWQRNIFVLTTERLLHQHQRGFFTRTMAETTYDNITDVRSSTQGIAQTTLGIGTIEVQTAGEGENMRLVGVRHPSRLQSTVASILRQRRAERSIPLSAQELVEALTRLKADVGEQAFHDILSRVPPADSRDRTKRREE